MWVLVLDLFTDQRHLPVAAQCTADGWLLCIACPVRLTSHRAGTGPASVISRGYGEARTVASWESL